MSGGRVLMKNGKVSCSCCSPLTCCLYPWPDADGEAGGPFYPSSDLPDTIIAVMGPDFSGEEVVCAKSGYVYTGTAYGGLAPYTFEIKPGPFQGELYLSGWEVGLVSNYCLIVELTGDPSGVVSIRDLFSSAYSVEGTWDINGVGDIEPIGVEVQREDPPNICSWSQPKDGNLFTLRYNSNTFKWEFSVDRYPDEILEKEDPQNSPVGNYGSSAHLFDVAIL
jgi:hypothetical protein